MALDVYIQEKLDIPHKFEDCLLQFEDDGYYWFLHPFFEDLAAKSNQMIDLYDGAFFIGEDLIFLNQTIQEIRQMLPNQPESWEVCIGTIVHKGQGKVEKIISAVEKKKLESTLLKLEKIIKDAEQKNNGILFFGD